MRHALSERFRAFAEAECRDSSALYHALSLAVAEDEGLLEMAERARPGQPVPNLFFATVHFLLAGDEAHPLRGFYASLTEAPGSAAEAFPVFREFVLGRRREMVALLESRLVQTNEVRRCAYLFPALCFAASHFEPKPLALVEIGTSAGLNLLWDRYRYAYGDGVIYGDSSSPVLISSSFRGSLPGILGAPVAEVSHRIGLDLNIVETSIRDEADWLRALVWPEHHERRSLMEAALKKRGEMTLDLRAGDGFAMLAGVAEEIPRESLLCVYHTHVANQISNEAKEAFLKSLAEVGKGRDVVHVFNNIKPNLHLTAYREGELIDMPLANTDGHARWIEWLAKDRGKGG